ncbi:MAG: secretion protein F [Muricomes sp.]
MERKLSVYGKMGLVFLLASGISIAVFLADSHQAPKKNKNGNSILERGGYGLGSREINLEARVGRDKEELTVKIGEQQYGEKELPKVFTDAADQLEKLILGENKKLDEVRYNLNLVNQIPDSDIAVTWETDNYEVINLMGELQQEHLKEAGTMVRLQALLSYGGEEAVHSFYVNIYPPKLNAKEKKFQKLNQEIQKSEEKTREKAYLILPGEVDGKSVVWKYTKDFRALGLFVLGIVAAVSIYALERQKEKQEAKEKKKQLEMDYPQLVSQFTLFLGAGMTVRRAWFKMVQDYERRRVQDSTRAVYEEMAYTMHEIQGGISEGECYERFGARCALPSYRKFSALLSQNLRKGAKGMSDLLRGEALEAFEERKKQARRTGEEAGTKLLGPMFMMLAVVLFIIVVPAFLTIQI